MQQITLIGNVGSEPEEKENSSGHSFTSFSVAVNVYSKEKKPPVWYKIIVDSSRPLPIVSHLKKGSGVVITGDLAIPKAYTNKSGEPAVQLSVKALSIRFAMSKKDDDAPASKPAQSNFMNEDIPF